MMKVCYFTSKDANDIRVFHKECVSLPVNQMCVIPQISGCLSWSVCDGTFRAELPPDRGWQSP